jgi:DNA-binding NtrC family response regulator
VAINCGAISESLLESELFGHEKGAFSGAAAAHGGLFEEAGEGTILLDEIGDIPPRLQLALLRVLETGETRRVGGRGARRIHCRILTATNADLDARLRAATFRQDLFFRLRRMTIHVPPLRRRREDILPLAEHFLNLDRSGAERALLSEALADALVRQPWPGNVRELRNSIERMRLMHSDKLYYDLGDLSSEDETGAGWPRGRERQTPIRVTRRADAVRKAGPARAGLVEGRAAVRRRERLRALFAEHKRLTRAEAARTLGISPNTATRDLRALCDEGTIRRVAPSASPRSVYFEAVD